MKKSRGTVPLSSPLYTYQFSFYCEVNVDTSCTPIAPIVRPPIVAELLETVKGGGWCSHILLCKILRISPVATRCGKCDTSRIPVTPRATPAATGKRRERPIQITRNEEWVKNSF
jgi:hypothetical protein